MQGASEVSLKSVVRDISNPVQDSVSKNHNENNINGLKPDKVTLTLGTQSKSEQKDFEELDPEQQRKVQELKDRDREVRAHEQAHAAVGGQYASAPSYEYETGPDGKKYAVGGEVSIDVSEEEKPEDTVTKMQVVRAAALAPAEPSAQDLKVAAEASQKESQARAEVSQNKLSPKPENKTSTAILNTAEHNRNQLVGTYNFAQVSSSIIDINA